LLWTFQKLMGLIPFRLCTKPRSYRCELRQKSTSNTGIICKKKKRVSQSELVPYLTPTIFASRSAKDLQKDVEKPCMDKPKMPGEGNEATEHGYAKKGEESPSDEEGSQEKEDSSSVKAASSKEKRKGRSKSDGSDAAADDSDKKYIYDDVPLSFPQRVSCCMSGLICLTCNLIVAIALLGDARIIHLGLRIA
jgi:hypothetical protein